jgi:hypothetical protein
MIKFCTQMGFKSEVVFECVSCSQEIKLIVPTEGIAKYQKGGFIQDCFPTLSCGERELFISGICNTCFDKMSPDEE